MNVAKIRHDIYPARGRKRCCHEDDINKHDLNSPRYLPRKGTETQEIKLLFYG